MDSFFRFHKLDVLNVTQNGDEDIIHLERRADECDDGTDCLTYSGWADNGELICDVSHQEENEAADDVLLEAGARAGSTTLVKRGKTTEQICMGMDDEGVVVDNGFPLSSPNWPNIDTLESVRMSVLDEISLTGEETRDDL